MKFKVGDKVKVVRNETDTRAVIGDIGGGYILIGELGIEKCE